MSNPRLSVIVTTCNGREPLLQQAVQSVQEQDYKDLEVVIIHDVSGNVMPFPTHPCKLDNTVYKRSTRPGTKRVGACVNDGLDLAKGEYVTYL